MSLGFFWKLAPLLMTQLVKNLPVVQETWEMQVRFLSWEDPLEEENCHLLQYPCLKNPRAREARQATAYGVLKSQTGLRE